MTDDEYDRELWRRINAELASAYHNGLVCRAALREACNNDVEQIAELLQRHGERLEAVKEEESR